MLFFLQHLVYNVFGFSFSFTKLSGVFTRYLVAKAVYKCAANPVSVIPVNSKCLWIKPLILSPTLSSLSWYFIHSNIFKKRTFWSVTTKSSNKNNCFFFPSVIVKVTQKEIQFLAKSMCEPLFRR